MDRDHGTDSSDTLIMEILDGVATGTLGVNDQAAAIGVSRWTVSRVLEELRWELDFLGAVRTKLASVMGELVPLRSILADADDPEHLLAVLSGAADPSPDTPAAFVQLRLRYQAAVGLVAGAAGHAKRAFDLAAKLLPSASHRAITELQDGIEAIHDLTQMIGARIDNVINLLGMIEPREPGRLAASAA
jgi:hypothetical protein